MPREYRHIQEYKKEILELREKGLTYRETSNSLGFRKEQIEAFFNRYHRKQRQLAAGIAIKKEGRSPKDNVVSKQDKVEELRYILAQKDAKIKSLEMENELMRDFLSLTERKRGQA